MEQGVQRLLLALAREAAEPAGAALGVDAAGLPGRQGAGEAAAAARLLHQLAAQRRRRAERQRLAVAGLALHEGAQAPRQPQAGAQQHQEPQQHRGGDAAGRGAGGCRRRGGGRRSLSLAPSGEKKKLKSFKKAKGRKAQPLLQVPHSGVYSLGAKPPAFRLALGEGGV